MDTDTGFEASQTVVAGQTGYAVPLIVAVTGHRDLVADEVPLIRAHVREFFRRLLDEFPERGITVMSSLAEGADQLVAEEALTLGISLIAPLPMPRELYLEDFETPIAREKFNTLLSQATEIFELPITTGNTAQTIAEHGPNRNRQYAQLGVFLCAHCHILLALWDGKESEELGGTGQVVRFHHDDVMPGYISRATTSRLVWPTTRATLSITSPALETGPMARPRTDWRGCRACGLRPTKIRREPRRCPAGTGRC